MKNLSVFILLILSTFSYAQEVRYVSPPDIQGDDYRVSLSDIVGVPDYCKFRLTIQNTSHDKHLVYFINKTGFEYAGLGTYYPNARKKTVIIPPKDKKSITLSIKGDYNHAVSSFTLHLDGLKHGKISESPVATEVMTLNPGDSGDKDTGPLCFEVSKTQWKKGDFAAYGKFMFTKSDNHEDEIMFVNTREITTTDADGNTLITELFPPEKWTFNYETDKKIKIVAKLPESGAVNFNFEKAVTKIDLASIDIKDLVLTDNSRPTQPAIAPKICPPYTAGMNGSVKIKVSSDLGCFQLYMLGELMTPEPTSSLTFRMNPSVKKVKIILDNGAMIEKNLFVGDDYQALYYNIKEKDGKYSLKYKAFASEPKEEGSDLIDEVTCGDVITDLDLNAQYKVTIQRITSSDVYYIDCSSGSSTERRVSKQSILAVKYSDGSYDKFDYNNDRKQGMGITRSRKEVVEKHRIATKGTNPHNQNSFIIGPSR